MRPKLLIVEDETQACALLDYFFTAAGFDVISATSGAAALRLSARHRPDVVLLDIVLPDMDGFTVCRRLRDRPTTSLIPVVVLSTHNGFSVQAAGTEAGARRCLSMSTEMAKIIAAVRLTWEEANHLPPVKM